LWPLPSTLKPSIKITSRLVKFTSPHVLSLIIGIDYISETNVDKIIKRTFCLRMVWWAQM
jgi:hypothetical protein